MKSNGFHSILSIGGTVFALLCSLGGNSAIAAEDAAGGSQLGTGSVLGLGISEKDFGFNFGVKAWYNEWDLPVRRRGGVTPKTFICDDLNRDCYEWNIPVAIPDETTVNIFQSSAETVFIPAFMLRFQDFVVTGSFFPEQKYKFKRQYLDSAYENVIYTTDGDGVIDNDVSDDHIVNSLNVVENHTIKPTAKRKEWELGFGCKVMPNLILGVGYKSMDRSLDYVLEGTVIEESVFEDQEVFRENLPHVTTHDHLSVNIPLLSVSVGAPLGYNMFLSGQFAYGFPQFEHTIDGDSLFYDGRYYFMELGLSYNIPVNNVVQSVTVNGGYRYQRLEGNEGEVNTAGEWNDTAQGFTLGVSAAF